MSATTLKGKRYIGWHRCSTTMQRTQDQQKSVIDYFAAKTELVWVRDVVLDGVSGMDTEEHLDTLLAEHRTHKSFDIILVHDFSRFTRGGIGQGSRLREKCAAQGILLIAVTEPLPEDGEIGELIASLIDYKNRAQLNRLAFDIARGIKRYIEEGDCEHHGKIACGIDRLYVRVDGTPFMRLVYAERGFRELYDEIHGTLIRRFEHKVDRNTAYRKMKGEKVRLVPSAPHRVELIREIFRKRYSEKWNYCRIARDLNLRVVLPYQGTMWRSATIRQMLLNPMYLGWSYNFVSNKGRHWEITNDGIVAAPKDRTARHKKPLEEFKSNRKTHLHLNEMIIDTEVRRNAEAAISKYFEHIHIPKFKRNVKNNELHPLSSYFLKDVMRDAKWGAPFTGRTGKRRYYLLQYCVDLSENGSTQRRSIPAEPLERVVLEILGSVLANSTKVQALIKASVNKQLSQTDASDDYEKLEAQQKAIEAKILAIYETSDSTQLKLLQKLVLQLRSQLEKVTLALSVKPKATLMADAPKIASAIISQLPDRVEAPTGLYFGKLRDLMNALCLKFIVDLSDMSIDMVFGLPVAMLNSIEQSGVFVSLPNSEVNFNVRQAHTASTPILGVFRLTPMKFSKWGRYNRVEAYGWKDISHDGNAAA